jgi:ribosomal protein S27AE
MQQLEMLEPAELLRCTTCKETKPVDEFNRDVSRGKRRHYRSNKCRSCEKAKNVEYYATNEEYRTRKLKRAKANNAHQKVYYAIKKGKLTRKPCEVCGVEEADAHHDDYAKPLEVRWLCRSHHTKWHIDNGEALNAFTVKHWTPPKEAHK